MTDDTDATRRALLKAAAGGAAATSAATAGCLSISTPADVANATEIGGRVDHFVGAGRLAEIRDDVVAVDARPREAFRTERVYRARHVPLESVTVRSDADGGRVPDVDAIASAFAERGIAPDDDVVVYGSSVGSRVTRIAFALLAAGHEGDVNVLNGGFSAWNGRVGTGDRDAVEPATYEPDPRSDLWVTRDWLAERVGSFNGDGPGLVDVRQPEAYLAAAGSDALDPDQERHGHLPGAVNVHWIGNVAGTMLGDPGDLYSLYANRAELSEDAPVVVYGDGNVDPTQTWLVLRALGFSDVRLYDGGFTEWANADDAGRYPVETATNAVIETDGEVGGGGGGGDFSCTG